MCSSREDEELCVLTYVRWDSPCGLGSFLSFEQLIIRRMCVGGRILLVLSGQCWFFVKINEALRLFFTLTHAVLRFRDHFFTLKWCLSVETKAVDLCRLFMTSVYKSARGHSGWNNSVECLEVSSHSSLRQQSGMLSQRAHHRTHKPSSRSTHNFSNCCFENLSLSGNRMIKIVHSRS